MHIYGGPFWSKLYNKKASQVTFSASAAFIVDLLSIFVITTQDFFSVFLFFFSCMNYFLIKAVYFFYVVV